MFLVLRRKDALGHVSAAARFRAGIPGRPPVDGEINEERDRRHPRRVEIGEECETGSGLTAGGIKRRDLHLERVNSSNRVNREHREQDHHAHLERELEKIGDQHTPQTRDRGIEGGEHQHTDQNVSRVAIIQAERDAQDLDHRQIHPAENDAVDRQAQIERAKAAEESGGFAGIT